MKALEEAMRERAHEMIFIRLDPSLDPLRGCPGFEDVVRAVRSPSE
jgi:hypothetical protein